jgi:fatty acid desaturase
MNINPMVSAVAHGDLNTNVAPSATSTTFSVHSLVPDLRVHKRALYWADFGLAIALFWSLIGFATYTPQLALAALTVVPASLALYRAALFSHEIGHFGKRSVPDFTLAWNALCGVPMGLPSFMLKSHVDHHGVASYGTARDPEYLPFAAFPQIKRAFWLGTLLVPWMFTFRAMALVPLAWAYKPANVWLRARMSYMTMNNAYSPSSDFQKLTRFDLMVEAATALWAYGLLALLITGALPWRFALLLLVCITVANLMNAWRTLRAHKYTSVGNAMDVAAQLRDSTTFTLPAVLGELLCPVGQRFHAAHHLFPYLPYHALAQAHERVMASGWAGLDDYAQTMK